MLQRFVELKIVVAIGLVQHHLKVPTVFNATWPKVAL